MLKVYFILSLAGIIFLGCSTSKPIKTTIEINAPAEKVFLYLGNSNHAQEWSIFVHHITPLNSDTIPDGQIGSKRRCFKKANENGLQWDETITEIIYGQKRELVCYNYRRFFLTVPNLATEQIYVNTDSTSSLLSFTCFMKNYQPRAWQAFKFELARPIVRYVFRRNLRNIKKIIENQEYYFTIEEN